MPPGELERAGELLVEEGVVLQEDLARGLAESGLKGSELGRLLDATTHVKRADLAAFLAANFRIPVVEDLRKLDVKPDAARVLPEAIARKHEVVPVARVGDILCVAKANFYNRAAVQELRRVTGLKIKVLQADEAQVRAAVDLVYGKSSVLIPPPGAKRPTIMTAAKPAPAPAPALEEVSSLELISPGDLEEVPAASVPGIAPAATTTPAPVSALPVDDVLEVLDAIRIPSQDYVSAGRHPLSRMVLEFEDLFAVGKPASPGRLN